ncbi:hypothetical protein NQZ79_g5565 [Umbelopsis isabellina]|nr:hypothetical protein NQZ79_g5565 [Umbelopsis isabellina]
MPTNSTSGHDAPQKVVETHPISSANDPPSSISQKFSKTHMKSSSWPHNRMPNEQSPSLRLSVPQPAVNVKHERALSDSYTPRRCKGYTPIIPRPHSSPSRPNSSLISSIPQHAPYNVRSSGMWPTMSDKNRHDYNRLGKELLPPSPDVAKERQRWMKEGGIYQQHRQVSFSETVVVISDRTDAETQNTEVSTLQLATDIKSFSRPQSPPPKQNPKESLSKVPPTVSSEIKTDMYDDSQLAMDLAEDIPSQPNLFSKFLTKFSKRFV